MTVEVMVSTLTDKESEFYVELLQLTLITSKIHYRKTDKIEEKTERKTENLVRDESLPAKYENEINTRCEV